MSSQAAPGVIDHHHDHTTSTGIPNKKLLWWAFLASDCMFFGALISTHLVYRLKRNGVFVNPVTAHRAMPPADPIPADQMAAFEAARDHAMAALTSSSDPRHE